MLLHILTCRRDIPENDRSNQHITTSQYSHDILTTRRLCKTYSSTQNATSKPLDERSYQRAEEFGTRPPKQTGSQTYICSERRRNAYRRLLPRGLQEVTKVASFREPTLQSKQKFPIEFPYGTDQLPTSGTYLGLLASSGEIFWEGHAAHLHRNIAALRLHQTAARRRVADLPDPRGDTKDQILVENLFCD